jgi:signal recognition particle subunit SRP72
LPRSAIAPPTPRAQQLLPPPLPPKQPPQKNTVLALAPNDADALAAKAVAHLELGEFDAASACLSDPASPLSSDPAWALERAYCLYRCGLLREAAALLGGNSGNDASAAAAAAPLPDTIPADRASAAMQLRAQLNYRLGLARACVADYEALLLQQAGAGAAAGAGPPLSLIRDPDTQAQLLEIKTNALAAHVAAGLGAQVPQLMAALKLPTGRAAQSYESEYNRACALLSASGGGGGGGGGDGSATATGNNNSPDFAAAEAALRHALRLGEEALYAEDLAEEEVLDELSPLHAQLAYVAACQGRAAEAAGRLEPLVAGELSDAATAAVAAVNHASCALAVAGGAGDPAAAKSVAAKALRRLEHAISDRGGGGGGGGGRGGASAVAAAASSSSSSVLAIRPDLASRLSPEQQRAVHLSRALLLGMAGRVDQAREVASALAKQQQQQQQSSSAAAAQQQKDPRVPLLLAALLARAGKAGEAEAALAALSDGDPMDEDGAVFAVDRSAPLLLRAQLAAEAGDAARAAALLAELPGGPSAALSPGILATRVTLLERAGRVDEAEALLEQGLGHWQQRAPSGGGKAPAAAAGSADPAAAGVGWCLQRLVSIKLAAGKTPEAMRLYQQLVAGGEGSKAARGRGGGGAAAAVAAGAAGAAVVARLARAAAAAGDADSVAALARQLPGGSADAAGAGLDTDALEDVTRVLGTRRGGKTGGGGKDAAAAAAAAAAAGGEGKEAGGAEAEDAAAAVNPLSRGKGRAASSKRKRKPRYPAGYDASKGPGGGLPAPDPERWLPKWERSTFKKQQRRRNRDARDRVVGSQGAGKVDDALDRTGKAEGAGPSSSAAAAGGGGGGAAARPALPPRAKGRPRK